MEPFEQLDLFGAAFVKAQAKFKHPKRDKTATVRHKTGGSHSYSYADFAATLDAVRPALNAEKISILQRPSYDAGAFVLRTTLLHESGQRISSTMPLPQGLPPQDLGSYITYYRRYALAAMCGIATEDDDDGASAQAGHAGRQREQAAPVQASDNVNRSSAPPPAVDLEAVALASLTPPPDATNQHRFETAVVELMNRGSAALAVTNEVADPWAEMNKRLARVLGAHGVESAAEITQRPAQMKFYRDLEATVTALEEKADSIAEAGL